MSVRVTGLRELQLAFARIGEELPAGMLGDLRRGGDLVRDDARGLFNRKPSWSYSASRFRTRVGPGRVAVEQPLRKTTGLHGNYGSLQMQRALLPALAQNEEKIVAGLELMLDRLGGGAGF